MCNLFVSKCQHFEIHSLYGELIRRDTTVAVRCADNSGVVVVQKYYCPFSVYSSVDKHPISSNSSEIVVAPDLYSFYKFVTSNN